MSFAKLPIAVGVRVRLEVRLDGSDTPHQDGITTRVDARGVLVKLDAGPELLVEPAMLNRTGPSSRRPAPARLPRSEPSKQGSEKTATRRASRRSRWQILGRALPQNDDRAVILLLRTKPLRETDRAFVQELHRTTARTVMMAAMTTPAIATVRMVSCASEDTTEVEGGG